MGGIARIPAMIAIASLMRSANGADTNGTNEPRENGAMPRNPVEGYRRDSEVRFRSQKLERLLNTHAWTDDDRFVRGAAFGRIAQKPV